MRCWLVSLLPACTVPTFCLVCTRLKPSTCRWAIVNPFKSFFWIIQGAQAPWPCIVRPLLGCLGSFRVQGFSFRLAPTPLWIYLLFIVRSISAVTVLLYFSVVWPTQHFSLLFFQESKLSPARVSVFLAGLRTANSRVLVLHYAGSGHRGLQVNALNLLLADDLCIYFVRPWTCLIVYSIF